MTAATSDGSSSGETINWRVTCRSEIAQNDGGFVPLWPAAYAVWLVLPPQPLRCAAAAAAGWPGEALCAPPLCRLAQLPDTGHWHPLHARASGLQRNGALGPAQLAMQLGRWTPGAPQ